MNPALVPTDQRAYTLGKEYCWLLGHSCRFSVFDTKRVVANGRRSGKGGGEDLD